MKPDTHETRDTLTVEELEKRIAPAVGSSKKQPPPPYPPGALYGLVRRTNLAR